MFEEMGLFDEIGKKIKSLAKVVFVLEVIASVILGLVLISVGSHMRYDGEGMTIFGLVLLLLGWLIAWVSSFFVYGFGELIDKTSEIARNTSSNAANVTDETSSEEPAQAETQTEQITE